MPGSLVAALVWVIFVSVTAFATGRWHWRLFYVSIPVAVLIGAWIWEQVGPEASGLFALMVVFKYRLGLRYIARQALARMRGRS
ncbi:MAG: DUF2484 family protein [Pseudomonadota bacterium]